MAKAPAKKAPALKATKPEKKVRLKRYKITSIGRYAKPTNKHKRRNVKKNGYRGQGRP